MTNCSCGQPLAPWAKATACVDCNRARCRKTYAVSKKKQNARRAEWYRENVDRARAYARSRPKINRYQKKDRKKCACGKDSKFSEKCKQCYKIEYRAQHVETVNAQQRKSRALLPDYYIRHLLTSYKTILTPAEIPQPLVALKREQLKIKKLCRKSQTSTN